MDRAGQVQPPLLWARFPNIVRLFVISYLATLQLSFQLDFVKNNTSGSFLHNVTWCVVVASDFVLYSVERVGWNLATAASS